MIQTTRRTESVLRTAVANPAIFKEELPAPRETLIKAGCCNTLLRVMGSNYLVSDCTSTVVNSNKYQMGVLNTASSVEDTNYKQNSNGFKISQLTNY